jgi:hypothetical protein
VSHFLFRAAEKKIKEQFATKVTEQCGQLFQKYPNLLNSDAKT